ncbi:unnamed protein product [Gongylonema pulchrum]|uniref:Peptidase_S26 domain-containing protein n=1 Tax=Gongylonema pulchrum TaxID=637853 RepID=A0A183CYL8_9BILA|nr:unnamed protein product [Gongylonema pulchrum]
MKLVTLSLSRILRGSSSGRARSSNRLPAPEPSTSSVKYFLIRLGTSVGILSVPIVFIDVVGYPASVVGSSMERDVVWLSRFGIHEPQIGQIFTFIPPHDPEKRHIKRVTATDGDIIWYCYSFQFLFFFSQKVQNIRKYRQVIAGWKPIIRSTVNKGLLTARATHIIWPPGRWGKIKSETFEHNSVPVSRGYRSLFGIRFPW